MDAKADRRQWRAALERRWSRKLDEVIALTAVREGISAADDDMSTGATATLPPRLLSRRAESAWDELGNLADAIMRIEAGTYGRCDGCGRQMADEWLAQDPTVPSCRSCLIDGLGSPVSLGSFSDFSDPQPVPMPRQGTR